MISRGVQISFSAACLVLPWAVLGCGENKSPPPEKAQVRLGGRTWNVELAMTDSRRYAGLSGRRELPPDGGMLFVYPQEQKLSFCMRGCEIPIDIAFLDRNLRVVNLYEMAVEPDRLGRTSYLSHVPVLYALEVAGGALKRAGVRVGDRAEFFGVPPAEQAEPGQ
ncbi:MAG: DUF192 domain-containing protein [Phycisphaerae bacterium]|nr:DUF192 domain-containing protein [Phycisphaerae bacterium]